MAVYAYAICDVFTERPLAGNQLAVFTDARAVPDSLLQPLAREINFAETVFVYPPAADGHARIRIFTPAAELRFAGHPVLGTAVVLGLQRGQPEVRLETGVGTVPVVLERREGRGGRGRMRQPVPTVAPLPRPERLLRAVGVPRSGLPVEVYDNGMRHAFVALDDEAAVARLAPDLAAVARLSSELGALFVGVNCFAGAGRRWKTRMFCPAAGVPEDAATGSAAGPLACHLARHGLIAFGDEIEIAQGAELERPSTLLARVTGSAAAIERVEVAGAAVVVGRGEFDL
jgi:trans-2,3-dihydro-3-hydroxyanthranilate isomerase